LNSELQKIIDKLETEKAETQASFGVFRAGGGEDESCIKANKQGLGLFALELLKASLQSEINKPGRKKNIYNLKIDEQWIEKDSDVFLYHIEIQSGVRVPEIKESYKPSFTDKLMPYGCGLVLIFLIVALIIGLVTIIEFIL
jgi:hypothetical protein